MNLVKICGIRKKLNNYDGIDLLGYNFINRSKRKINKSNAKNIYDDILIKGYSKIKNVGLYDDKLSLDDILNITEYIGLKSIQLYSNNLENFKILKQKGYFLIKPIKYYEQSIIYKYNDYIDLFIVDGEKPGSGKKYDYSKINNLEINKPFLVAGGVNKNNILSIYKIFKNNSYFSGVDIASGIDNGKNIDEQKIIEIIKLINNKNV